MKYKNCAECPHFERGFLSEPNECAWFQAYVNVPKKGIPIWCPLKNKKATRDQLLQLYRLEYVRADYIIRLSDSMIISDLPKISEETIKKLAKMVYPNNPLQAGQLEDALKDSSKEKINKFWEQTLTSLEGEDRDEATHIV